MARAFLALGFLSSPAFSHPGHGALELHWHAGDMALAVLGFLVFLLVVFVIRKAWKK